MIKQMKYIVFLFRIGIKLHQFTAIHLYNR